MVFCLLITSNTGTMEGVSSNLCLRMGVNMFLGCLETSQMADRCRRISHSIQSFIEISLSPCHWLMSINQMESSILVTLQKTTFSSELIQIRILREMKAPYYLHKSKLKNNGFSNSNWILRVELKVNISL